MNSSAEPVVALRRATRVVSLPCGHQVYVQPDASLLAVSGPVLDHQSSCRGPSAMTLAAWFVPGPVPRPEAPRLSEPGLALPAV